MPITAIYLSIAVNNKIIWQVYNIIWRVDIILWWGIMIFWQVDIITKIIKSRVLIQLGRPARRYVNLSDDKVVLSDFYVEESDNFIVTCVALTWQDCLPFWDISLIKWIRVSIKILQVVTEICHHNRLLNKVAIDWECSGLHDVIFNIMGVLWFVFPTSFILFSHCCLMLLNQHQL